MRMRISTSTSWAKRPLAGLIAVVASSMCADSDVVEVEWKRDPIVVHLAIGEERRVTFPNPVRVGTPSALSSELRIQIAGDSVYFRALEEIDDQRIVAVDAVNQKTYLLDIFTQRSDQELLPMVVKDLALKASDMRRSRPTYIELTRFAAQQLYAPTRLRQTLQGAVVLPVPKNQRLIRQHSVRTDPLVSWRVGALYVTAVLATNTGPHGVLLKPETFRGRWLAATPHHYWLQTGDGDASRTVIYLVSSQSFAESF